jgi:hypothetical protein
MPNHTSIIDEIWRAAPSLHAAECRVAEIVLADIDAATHMSTKELSQLAQVSEPTVVRFARRMGSSGFAEFKIRLSQDIVLARMFVLPQQKSLAGNPTAVVNQVYEATAQALAYSFAQRDPAALEHAVDALHAARRVFCMGVGGSSAMVAQEAENRLFRFDVHATAVIAAVALRDFGRLKVAEIRAVPTVPSGDQGERDEKGEALSPDRPALSGPVGMLVHRRVGLARARIRRREHDRNQWCDDAAGGMLTLPVSACHRGGRDFTQDHRRADQRRRLRRA